MRLQHVAARQGHQWVRQGFRVFVRHPMGFAGLFAAFLLIVFLLATLPYVGVLLLLMLMPLGSLAFMVATQQAEAGRLSLVEALIGPLRTTRAQRIALLKLGLVYAASTWLIVELSSWVDGGALQALMQAQGARDTTPQEMARLLSAPGLQAGLLLRFSLFGLLSVPFWHAPALVHWDAQPAGKSLFFSTIALWRNRGAFFVYSLTWLGVFVLYSVVANLLFAVLGSGQLVTLLAMPASMIFATVFYASLYFTFADCFAPEAGTSPPATLTA